ncbi:hypothetical protein [Paraeggerthella hongkongensis]|uniref:Uncharacterized protein n=1 Tax=Paraeggerthella hongkongensis TaxID=230658 RepID=A0A3N0BF62_9ACTN|nr:hypothetical protein [Paraeggerthella hongkongensis]RNL46019.1 hypothetical protein DMP08_04745 [Paraeggerthella hongkongensis]
MNVQIFYDNGRVDEFDVEHFTLPQPFDGNNMLTNFEVRFDNLDTESLWLQAHFYDIRPEYRQDAKPESTPVARRMRGWRFLLVDKSEIGHVARIVVNNESVAWRQGESLINGIRFNAAMLACYTDETAASNNRKAIVLHDYLANADPLLAADEDELCARFGYTRDAYEQALMAEGCQPVDEADSGHAARKEAEEASSGWLDDLGEDEEG